MRAFAVFALAGVAAAQPFLTDASGRVELPLRADQITVQLGVVTESRSAADAADRNAARVRAAMDAARRSAGSSGVRLYYYDLEGPGSSSFTVTARFEATVPDLASATRLADAAREAGGAQLISIEDSQRDTTGARQSAIRMAAQEARRNLDSLAEAAGGRVERLAAASAFVSPVFTIRTGDFSFIPRLPREEIATSVWGFLSPSVSSLSARANVQLAANLAGAPSTRSIVTVSGDASVPIEPDQAEVRLGLVHLGSSAQAAAADLTARSQAAQAALRRLVGPGGDVVASRMRLEHTPANPQRRTLEGFRATQEIRVSSSDLANAARLIDAAMSAGANSFNGLMLGLRDEGTVQRELERQAIRRAVADAGIVAAALNARTGSVLAVRSAPAGAPASRVDPFDSYGADLRRHAGLYVDIELLQ